MHHVVSCIGGHASPLIAFQYYPLGAQVCGDILAWVIRVELKDVVGYGEGESEASLAICGDQQTD